MNRLGKFGNRIVGLFVKRRRDSGLEDEFAAHLDLLAQENIRRGMPRDEAQYCPCQKLGSG